MAFSCLKLNLEVQEITLALQVKMIWLVCEFGEM